jgi:tRNA-splicing ligase RtcB (3'-phosphate/5'-hydroxy nucleic acid ligase)
MELSNLKQIGPYEWRIPRSGAMRVPGIIYADRALISDMDEKVREQVVKVACLPGIIAASYAMPDAHWGYGFPIGGVAAFAPDKGGVVSAGGVGFDISCGVRCLLTGLARSAVEGKKADLADRLFAEISGGVGSHGRIVLNDRAMDEMLAGGAAWAVAQGHGEAPDLQRIEESGRMADAKPEFVSDHAKNRQRREMGTLGSGNHYLEVQAVAQIFEKTVAKNFGLAEGQVVVSIHCGSRGLGHQIGTEFLREMVISAPDYGITLIDRELACASIESPIGERYLGAMRAAINCALANRQTIGSLTRRVFATLFPDAGLPLLFDVSHNTCKVERHQVEGQPQDVYIHRKGATRAFGPDHPDVPSALRPTGQPVLIGGTMGTASYVLVGASWNEARGFSSACHGAGRQISRHQARKLWHGRQVVDHLAARGIIVRSPSYRAGSPRKRRTPTRMSPPWSTRHRGPTLRERWRAWSRSSA